MEDKSKWWRYFPGTSLENSTSHVFCIESNQEIQEIAVKNKLVVMAFSVWEEGYICKRHFKKITGWHDDNGKSYDDDGYCEEKVGCWSEKGKSLVKRLFILSPEISLKFVGRNGGIKRKILKEFLMKELPQSVGFKW